MSIKIYKDLEANSIFIEDANGAQFLNSLQASAPGDKVTIKDLARQIDIVSDSDHTNFIDKDGNTYPGNANDVCNELNAIFQSSGTPTGDIPVITSSLSINSVEGAVVNYELVANFAVAYEWDLSTVVGLTTVEGNPRKLIGGSNLADGVYNIPVKAINYNGEDSKILVLTVSNPPFSNTKSIIFQTNDYLNASGSEINSSLGRTSNGSGQSWTVSLYFKAGSSNNSTQSIFYAGGGNPNSDNGFYLHWKGNSSSRRRLEFTYGSQYNNLRLSTPVGSVLNNGNWYNIVVSFNGGTTGNSSNPINDYYSRFKIFIDGVLQTTSKSNQAFGNASPLTISSFRLGRWGSASSYLKNSCKLDEVALWNTDQSANVSNIYNSGVPFNLSSLSNTPSHWWRMGDGDTYPVLVNSVGSTSLNMVNMTAADIVNDTP